MNVSHKKLVLFEFLLWVTVFNIQGNRFSLDKIRFLASFHVDKQTTQEKHKSLFEHISLYMVARNLSHEMRQRYPSHPSAPFHFHITHSPQKPHKHCTFTALRALTASQSSDPLHHHNHYSLTTLTALGPHGPNNPQSPQNLTGRSDTRSRRGTGTSPRRCPCTRSQGRRPACGATCTSARRRSPRYSAWWRNVCTPPGG